MAKSIDEIYKQRPNIIRNSMVIWVIKVTAIVCGIVFFGFGIGLLIMGESLIDVSNYLTMNEKGTEPEQMERVMYLFGFLSLLGGVVMAILAYFSHLILVRNRFIKNLEGWFNQYYNSTEEEKTGMKKRKV